MRRETRLTLRVVGAVGFVLVLWFVFGGTASSDRDANVLDDGATPGAEVRNQLAHDAQMSAVELAPGGAFERRDIELAASETEPDPSEYPYVVKIEVLDQFGSPAVDAEVRYLPPMRDEQRELVYTEFEHEDHVEAMLRQHGRRAQLDQKGWADLVCLRETPISARLGESFALLWSIPTTGDAPRLRMKLQSDVTLDVEVVDHDGAAVDDVSIWATSEIGAFDWNGGVCVGVTDAEGRLRVPHLQTRMELPGPEDTGELSIHLGVPGRRSASESDVVRLPAVALRDHVSVRFRTATTGFIEVKIVDADGAPLAGKVGLHLEGGRAYETRSAREATSAFFELIPLGRRWRIVGMAGGNDAEGASVLIDGPRRSKECTVVELRLPLRRHTVRAQVVADDGQPIVGSALTASLRLSSGVVVTARGDASGRIAFGPFDVPESVGELDFDVTVESPLLVTRSTRFSVGGTGEHDLGEILVSRSTGHVLLASIDLRLDGRPAPEEARASLYQRDPEAAEDTDRLVRVPASVHREGSRFEFHGPVPERPIRLICYHPECVREVIEPFAIGSQRVVELRRAAALSISILPPAVPIESIRGQLLRLDDRQSVAAEFSWSTVEPTREVIEWKLLEPGDYSLRIFASDLELWSIQRIELRPGLHQIPVDGTRLDLRGRAVARAVRIRSSRSSEYFRRDVATIESRASELPAEEHRHDVDSWFIPRDPPQDLLIAGFGHVPVRIVAPVEDVDVALEPSVPIELAIDDPAGWDHARGRLVRDGTSDPVLRAFDDFNVHAPEFVAKDVALWFVPGSIVEFWLDRDGVRTQPIRITVGESSPPPVRLR